MRIVNNSTMEGHAQDVHQLLLSTDYPLQVIKVYSSLYLFYRTVGQDLIEQLHKERSDGNHIQHRWGVSI